MFKSPSVRKNIVDNLRQHFGEKIASFSDDTLLQEYEDFSLSEWYGNNDERFLEWLGVTD